MSEASEIARLQGYTTRLEDVTDSIAQAITAKGGTVSSGDKLEEFSADIATIPSGGGTHSVSFNTAQLAEYGKITASCGGTSSTHTLSSSDDSDFVAGKIAKNVKIFGVTGSYTSDATASASDILTGETAYVNGSKVAGTMANKGSESITISSVNDSKSISEGYHNGSGKVSIADSEKAKLIPENIAAGQTILGVIGSHSGGGDPITPPTPSTYIASTITSPVTGAKTVSIGAKYQFSSAGYVSDTSEKSSTVFGQTQIGVGNLLDANSRVDITENTEGTNYVDVSEYKWAKVNVHDGGIDPSSSTAVATDIRAGKTAYISGSTAGHPTSGTMADLELAMPTVTTSVTKEIGKAAGTMIVDASYTIPTGGGYATAGTYTTNRTEGYVHLHGATVEVDDLLDDDKSLCMSITANTQGENYYDVGSYKWAKVNVQGGGGASTVYSNTTPETSSRSSSYVDMQSLTITSGGDYEVYAVLAGTTNANARIVYNGSTYTATWVTASLTKHGIIHIATLNVSSGSTLTVQAMSGSTSGASVTSQFLIAISK